MIIENSFDQLSPEWFAARLGNPGASSFDQILTNVTGKPSKSAEGYMMQLAGEVVAGKKEEGYTNANMERGILLEEEARNYFEFQTNLEVEQVALCYPNDQKKYHISPDGLCSDGGGLEIKCPKMKTHVKYLVNGKFPKIDYNGQVQGSLMVTGLSHWWFMSYYPGIRPFIVKVLPDKEYIGLLESALDTFCLELAKMIVKVKP